MDARDAIAAAIVAQAMEEAASGRGVFDPTGFTGDNTMQGGLPTGRDVFDNTPAEDWGGVLSEDATMSAPAMTASPHATPTFDVDKSGMPNAPTFDFNAPGYTPAAPATPGEGGSLTDPGLGALGALGAGDIGGLGMGAGGLGAVGGTEGIGGTGDPSGGSVG